jgi:cytochrome c
MKLIAATIVAATALVASNAAMADMALAKAKNCMSCHAVDKKVVGPAYQEVAKKYKAADEAKLVEKVMKGGSGAWGTVPMPPNPQVKQDEAQKLVKWILAGAK